MVLSIAEVVSQFKREWTEWLAPAELSSICKEVGLEWRERILSPATTIQLFLLQILHGNTAITHLRHLSGLQFSATAYCKARMRVPLLVFEKLLEQLRKSLEGEDFQNSKWLGHRVFMTDGTGISMSDVPELKEHFGYPHRQRKDCSFPVAKLLVMMHFQTGMVVKAFIDPLFTHDISKAPALHSELQEGDIILGDRAFCSYHHFSTLISRGVHAVIRMHQRIAVDFTPGRAHVPPGGIPSDLNQPKSRWVQALGVKDQIVEWFKPRTKPKSMSRDEYNALPDSLTVRELQYRIQQKGFRTRSITIMTTLLDGEKYPKHKIAELYHFRWDIETNFDHLKTTMKMDILKSKTVDGIKKEILAYFVVYNLVRLVMVQAARKQRAKLRDISFIDALRWLAATTPDKKLASLIIVPDRKGRLEPRSRKRRPKQYPFMIKSRIELRKKKLSEISQYDTGLSS